MEDYSHLRGADGDDENKPLINSEGAGHEPKNPKALLDEMKYISGLIERVISFSFAFF